MESNRSHQISLPDLWAVLSGCCCPMFRLAVAFFLTGRILNIYKACSTEQLRSPLDISIWLMAFPAFPSLEQSRPAKAANECPPPPCKLHMSIMKSKKPICCQDRQPSLLLQMLRPSLKWLFMSKVLISWNRVLIMKMWKLNTILLCNGLH